MHVVVVRVQWSWKRTFAKFQVLQSQRDTRAGNDRLQCLKFYNPEEGSLGRFKAMLNQTTCHI